METIAVDFDGVIHRYSKGWHDGTIYDIPMPGCREAMLSLSEKYRIVIFSTRNYDRVVEGKEQRNQLDEMQAWLRKYDIPYDYIYTATGKPICKLFIDDNAYRFIDWSLCVAHTEQLMSKRKEDCPVFVMCSDPCKHDSHPNDDGTQCMGRSYDMT